MNVKALVHRMGELVDDPGEGPAGLSAAARRAADEEAHFRRMETALDRLSRARDRLAGARPSGDGKVAKARKRAGELVGHAETVDRRFRQCLTLLKLHGAVVWWRVRRPLYMEEDEDDGAPGNLSLSYLDATLRFIEDLNEIEDQTFEGRSRDSRITVRADSRGHLVDSGFGDVSLGDPAFKASLIEAVNAAIESVGVRRDPMKLFAEAEARTAKPADADVDDGRDEVPWEVVDEIVEALEMLLDVREALQRVRSGRSSATGTTAAIFDEIIPRVAQAEGMLRESLPLLAECFSFLTAKIGLPEVSEEDLDLTTELEELFFEDGFDDLWGVDESDAHIAEILVLGVTSGLEEERKRIEHDRHWKAIRDRQQSRVDEVETRTFEASSDDGTVVARTNGKPRLLDLVFDAENVSDRGSFGTAVIGAVNAALEKSEHERARAMLIGSAG